MRRLGVLIGTFLIVTLAPAVASAAGCSEGTVPTPGPGGGTICIPAIDPGGAGEHDAGGGGGSTGSTKCVYEGVDIACQDPLRGTWSNSHNCYLLGVSPQPPSGAEEWQGRSSSEGSLYVCIRPGIPGNPTYVFVPGGTAPPDPAVLARRALGELRLVVPDVHLAPSPPARTYVGLKTWLWMPAGQWSPLSKSVTAGATTVRVVAAPWRVVWDMGPGSTTCHSAGRVWRVGQMPAGSATDCSYTYTTVSDFQRSKNFTVSATITYQVDWTCSGTCLVGEGTLGEVDGLPGTSAIAVGERQSVVVNGGGR